MIILKIGIGDRISSIFPQHLRMDMIRFPNYSNQDFSAVWDLS